MARLDRLEMRLEKQQKRDKAHRVLAARAMLKHRPEGPRGGKRLDQVGDERSRHVSRFMILVNPVDSYNLDISSSLIE